MRPALDRRRVSLAATVTVPLLVGALALTQRGFPVQRLDLDDGGVWLTSKASMALGRYNVPVAELDGGLTSTSASLDVAQDGYDVLLLEQGQASVVDTTTVAVTDRVALTGGQTVQMAGGTVAVTDDRGDVWVRGVAAFGRLDLSGTAADLTLGSGGRAVVARDGAVLAVKADGSTQVRRTDGSTVADGSLATAPGSVDQLTAVGDEPVVLDGHTVRTRHGSVTLDGDHLTLQQPGPASDVVLVSSADALVEVPLAGGTPRVHALTSSGTPAAPVRVGGCAYAAWASASSNWLRLCGTDVDSADRQGVTAADQLVFRVNRSQVVLNDAATGRAWLQSDPAVKVPDWQQITPQAKADPQNTSGQQSTQTQTTQCSDQTAPPVAADDHYGVRPGRSTVLHVLANDSTSDCGILVISTVDPIPASFGTVRMVDGGRALEVDTAEHASGSVSFTYTVTDHPGARAPATATVTLTVHPPAENSPPEQVRTPELTLGESATASVDVLDDFVDPDGDPLVLVGATLNPVYGTVSHRPDGLVTISSASQVGSTTVALQVSDGIDGAVAGTLEVHVQEGAVDPVIDPVHATGYVNQAVTVSPLTAVRSSTGQPARLAGVSDVSGATVAADLTAGTFQFTAKRAGTYYVSFTVVTSPTQAVGWARIDIVEFPAQVQPPVAVADVGYLRGGGTLTVDPLDNDTDPSNLVLAVTEVDVPDGTGLHAAVVDHRQVVITCDRTLTAPVSLTYTVSNGTASASSSILVVPVPASAVNQPPVVGDVEVTVRTGGVVTVDPLAEAYDPDGDTVTLDPTLPQALPSGEGLLFVSGEKLRYQAPDTPMTVTATFQVLDAAGAATAGHLVVHVHASDPAGKQPPTPTAVQARVFAGQTVRIPIPLTGIDPDGDGVTLLGLGDDAPTKGQLTTIGADYLQYQAFTGQYGTDTFSYAVEDWTGQRAEGTVQVAVVPRPVAEESILARDDAVTVGTGRTVEVDVLANDIDSEGDDLHLDSQVTVSGQLGSGSVQVAGDQVVVHAPSSAAVLQVLYTAQDDRGGRSTGVLTVTVEPNAPVEDPVAGDVVVPATQTIGRTQVEVDVLAAASNPSGPLSELQVAVPASAASVASVTADRKVLVTLGEHTQIVPYQLVSSRDPKASAYAFITVPALGFFAPIPRPKAPELRVASGQSITIQLDAQVQVAPGRVPTLADAGNVRATNGTAVAVDASTVRFTAGADYAGPATVTVVVTDSTGSGDTDARRATISLSVTVYAIADHPPTFTPSTLGLPAGEPARTFDLASYLLTPEGKAPTSADGYTFTLTAAVPAGFTAHLDGSRLTASAVAGTAKGTTGQLAVKIGYGRSGSLAVTVPLQVVASDRPLARVQDVTVGDGRAGQPSTVQVLTNAYNPFADTGGALTVVDAQVETAGAGSVTFTGSSVTVTPAPSFVGTMVARFTVSDVTGDPDRQVDARVTVVVAAAPAAPAAPRVTEIHDGGVTLTWTAPDSHGSPITGYRVMAAPGGSEHDCPTTSCVIDGLTNGTTYTFTVAAGNAVGWSDPSDPSGSAEPDAVPDAPAAPSLIAANGSVTATWTPPTDHGSPVVGYDVSISPAPTDHGQPSTVRVTGTSTTFSGLTNGTGYSVQVRAWNSSPQPGAWSAWSAAATPAAVPDSPGGLTASRVDTPLGGQIEVGWTTPASNGAPLTGYQLTIAGGSGSARAVALSADQDSYAMTGASNGVTYTFTLVALNAAGTSSAAVVTASTYGVPGAVSGLTLVGQRGGGYGAGTAVATWTAADGNGSPVTSYQVRSGSHQSDVGTATTATLTGLTGGQDVSVSVRACNAAGCGAWVDPVGSVPDPVTVPGQVSNLAIKVTTDAYGSPTRVVATWANPDWGGSTQQEAYVPLLTSSTGAAFSPTSVTGTSATFTGDPLVQLDGSTTRSASLTVSVVASTAVGAGVAATRTTQVSYVDPPAAPQLSQAWNAAGTVLTVSWPAVPGADRYDVQLTRTEGDGTVTVIASGSTTGTTASKQITAALPLSVMVRAVDTTGPRYGPWATADVIARP